MLGMKKVVLVAGAVMMLGAGGMVAQEPAAPAEEGMHRGHRGPAPEMILAFRERLELTDDQVAALDEVRERMVSVRSSHRAAMAQLRSRFQAGEIDRAEMLASMEAIRSGGPDFHQEVRDRVETILDEGQLAALEELRAERGAMRGAHGRMRPGRGMRGGPGAMPGGRTGDDGPGAMRRGGMRGGQGMSGGPGAPGGPMARGACPHMGPTDGA